MARQSASHKNASAQNNKKNLKKNSGSAGPAAAKMKLAAAALKSALFGGASGKKKANGADTKKTSNGLAKKAAPVAAPKGAKAAAAPKTVPAALIKGAKPARAKGTNGRNPNGPGTGASARAAAAEDVCREVACEGLATSAGYCRMHYIKSWKKIKRKELILKEGKLNQYIEELVAKYPDKYIEAIRQDLESDKDFAKVIYDLDLDESVDEFTEAEGGENIEQVIDTIKRDFDDEGEGGF